MTEDQHTETPSIHAFVRLLRRRWWVVVLCTVLVPCVAYVATSLQDDEYKATASLFFGAPEFADELLNVGTGLDPGTGDGDTATNLDLVSLDTIAARTARAMGGGVTPAGVAASVEVTSSEDSNVISILVTQPEPVLAARMANTYARQYIAFRASSNRGQIMRIRRLLEGEIRSLAARPGVSAAARSRRGSRLRGLNNQLELLAAVQTGDAEIVQQATPAAAPVGPKPVRNAGLGLVVGLFLGIALALLFDLASRRLNDPRDLENVFDRPIVGAIPESRALSQVSREKPALPAAEREAFQMLQTNLSYAVDAEDVRSVLVTSAAPGDGKTTVAWSLAAAGALGGASVLLLEAELRRPSLVRRFQMDPGCGLSHILAQDADPEEAIQRVTIAQRVGHPTDVSTMDVIVAGPLPPNPTELLQSERMKRLIGGMEARYDLVVVDTPPLGSVPDAIPLIREVSGVIAVTRVRKSDREALAGLRAQLDAVGARLLGVVVNGVSNMDGYYGYGYGYGHGSEHASPPPRSEHASPPPRREAVAMNDNPH